MWNNSEALWTVLAALKFRPLIYRLTGFTRKDRGGIEVGKSLSSTERAEMEELLGYDFGDVRIYDSQQAGEIARQLNAEAFTAGNNIFSAEGKLNTTMSAGKALLAHELTHVAQQTQRNVASWSASEGHLPRKEISRINANHEVPQVAASSPTGALGSVVQRAREAEAQAVERSVRETSHTRNSPTAEIDAEDIADRVYRLMQSELILEKERART